MINIRNKNIIGKSIKLLGVTIIYWGKSQSHKWRWNITHFDMGIISVYDLPISGIGKYFWLIIAFLCKPLRKIYHNNYCNNTNYDDINDMNHFR